MEQIKLAESYGTLSETINSLVRLGYTHDFNIHHEEILWQDNKVILQPEDFQIDKVYRFEGESNPEDQAILYAISSPISEVLGTLVNGYGNSSDEYTSKLIQKLETNLELEHVEEKSDDSNPHETDVVRDKNLDLVEMNLPKFISQLKKQSKWIEGDRISVTIFRSETMRIVLMGLHKNAELKSQVAKGVISVLLVEGEISFVTEEKQVVLESGQMIALQANITHSVVAIKESFFLLHLSIKHP